MFVRFLRSPDVDAGPLVVAPLRMPHSLFESAPTTTSSRPSAVNFSSAPAAFPTRNSPPRPGLFIHTPVSLAATNRASLKRRNSSSQLNNLAPPSRLIKHPSNASSSSSSEQQQQAASHSPPGSLGGSPLLDLPPSASSSTSPSPSRRPGTLVGMHVHRRASHGLVGSSSRQHQPSPAASLSAADKQSSDMELRLSPLRHLRPS